MEPEHLEIYRERMRVKALEDFRCRVPINSIQKPYHLSVLKRAIKNILSTDLATFTFAQIIDGIPTGDVAWDRRFPMLHLDHPIDNHELCHGCGEKAREVLQSWGLSTLKLNPDTIEAYDGSEPGSDTFNLRLIELVATSINQIGVLVNQLKLRLHQGDIDSILYWQHPDEPQDRDDTPPDHRLRSTLFILAGFCHTSVYPEGDDSLVGYWAEDRIFGGVVAFDRREPDEAFLTTGISTNWRFGPDGERPSYLPDRSLAWMMSSRAERTFRQWQLLGEQQAALVKFLLAEQGETETCPLPILSEYANTERVDAGVPLFASKVYRDVWERMPIDRFEEYIRVRRPRDWPDCSGYSFELWRWMDEHFPNRKTTGVRL